MISKLLTFFRILIRSILILWAVVSFLIVATGIHLVTKGKIKRRWRFVKLNHWYAQFLIAALNVKLEVINAGVLRQGNYLVISNHLGFVDIFCLAKLIPSCFITSQEMRETPVLGLITEMGGCIYVERRNRFKMLNEIANITQALKEGFNVLLYPEAQSHNGEMVLPFKRNLIMAAAQAGVPILPAVFNFKSIEGMPFTIKNRDQVCWYGKMSFIKALYGFCKTKFVEAEIEFLNPVYIYPSDDKALVADTLHRMIAHRFKKVQGVGPSKEKGPSLQDDPSMQK